MLRVLIPSIRSWTATKWLGSDFVCHRYWRGVRTNPTNPPSVRAWYMPPEALAAEPCYDEKIDIFSFGVLMLEIATQREPSPGLQNIGRIEEKDRQQRDLDC